MVLSSSFARADALIFAPAQHADTQLLPEQMIAATGDRQTCWATLAISNWLSAAWSLMYWQASRTRLSSGDVIDANRLHPAQ